MPSLVGYTRTGRIQLGPGSDLVEMQGPDGARHTAIVFHPEYRSHNAINAALGVVLSFLESPMVTGLTDLGAYDLGESSFVYPTGQAWSVAEVVRTLADLGEVGGVRAGVELMVQVGQILVEAAETGELAGVYSHGGLTPWRVMLDADGRVQVIGHALPQVEILTFHEQPDRIPREDAFRYCPPERMESRRENFSSDLFGLGLIAFEVMCGKPVYDGLVNDIRAKAARGETSRRIHQFREFLPESVRTLLTTTLRPDFRDRFGAGQEFFDAADAALKDRAVQGVGLREMMQRVIRQQPRARQELDPAKTSMLSKDALKKMMDEEDAPAAPRPGASPQRAAFAPPPRRPAEAPPLPAAPAREVAAPPARELPLSQEARAAELMGSSSRVGLPPSRRPPPRTGGEVLADAAPSAPPPAPPIAQPPPSPSAAGLDPARFGPPLRSGARPNPRASTAGEPPAPEPPRAPAPPAAPVAPAPRLDGDGEPPRPAIGVARLPPSRRPPSAAAEPEPAPAPQPSLGASSSRAVPPPPAINSGDRAKDLLARVRASGSEHTPRATPSASSVLDRILTTSSGGQNLKDRVARAVQESEARDAAELSARPPPVPPPVAPPVPPPAAPPPLVATPAPAPPPLVATPAAAPPPIVATPVAAPPPLVATPAATPPPIPASPAAAPPVSASPPPVPAAPPPVPAAPLSTPSGSPRIRTSDALKSGLRGEPQPYKIARSADTPAQRRRLPAASSLADVVGHLVGQVVPLRVGLDGRLLGWYRLGPAAGPLPADTRLDSLDPEQTLVLHFVESRLITLDIEVHAADRVTRLRTPLATATPVASLVDALAVLLDLSAGEWAATLDGAALEPLHILDDRPVTPRSVLVVRRA